MMYVRSVSTRPARTLSARPARATGEARLARSPATQQTLFFALSFAAVGLRGTTGAAKADTAVFLVFTGAHVREPGVEILQAREVAFHADRPEPLRQLALAGHKESFVREVRDRRTEGSEHLHLGGAI